MLDQLLSLLPIQASKQAVHIDQLFYTLTLASFFITLAICLFILVFSIRYRKRKGRDKAEPVRVSYPLEVAWAVIPFLLLVGLFIWGTRVYLSEMEPPENALNVAVVGKQWMWKFEHPSGRMEINELHVPVGQPVRLTMISQDVIHSLFVPAFRIKQDVLPGRYSTLWFEATKSGEFHLFCSQYCGTNHSEMTGRVVALAPADYEEWVSTGAAPGAAPQSPTDRGRQLFETMACATCHRAGAGQVGPAFNHLIGSKVTLSDGTVITADENYVRESILDPGAKIVRGYQNVMPTFRGRLSEDEVLALIAYVKTLGSTGDAGSKP